MEKIFIVLDTGYLLEIFKVPNYWNTNDAKEIIKRYKRAVERNYSFFLPIACIYEFANHLADVRNSTDKIRIANNFFEVLKKSLDSGVPWTIVPYGEIKNLTSLFESFKSDYLTSGIGLTDTSIVFEANRLKNKYKSFSNYKIHIWTTDGELKSREPDSEEDAFLGR